MKLKGRRVSANVMLDYTYGEKPGVRFKDSSEKRQAGLEKLINEENEARQPGYKPSKRIRENAVENVINRATRRNQIPLPTPRGVAPKTPTPTQVTPGDWTVTSPMKLRATREMMNRLDRNGGKFAEGGKAKKGDRVK